MQEEEEAMLIIKTKTDLLERLKEAVVSHHPYQVPEFIALPASGGPGLRRPAGFQRPRALPAVGPSADRAQSAVSTTGINTCIASTARLGH